MKISELRTADERYDRPVNLEPKESPSASTEPVEEDADLQLAADEGTDDVNQGAALSVARQERTSLVRASVEAELATSEKPRDNDRGSDRRRPHRAERGAR